MELNVSHPGAIERAIQELEGIIVIIRRRPEDWIESFVYKRASRHDITVLEFLENRLGPIGIKPEEVVIVDGNHQFTWGSLCGKITMGYLRDTFKEKVEG